MPDSTIPFPRKNFIEKTRKSRSGKAKETAGHFLINKQSAVPLHIQLKEQVRYAIMSGKFEPGNPLPSIRELTGQLGIHRNTVHRVYLELQAGGLLISKPGKGVFVNESLSDVVTSKELNAIDDLINRYFQEANLLGVNPFTLAKLSGQRAPSYDTRHPIVSFVECTAHQSQECAKDLAEAFGISVQHQLLEELISGRGEISDDVKHVVTSIFHYDDVLKLVGKESRKKVHAVTYDLHPATRKVLREIAPDRKLGFICHDANTEEVIGAQIIERVPEGVFQGCANVENPKHALKLIERVDTVILSEAASEFCVKHCTPAHELLELHYSFNKASVDKVTRGIMLAP